ncbi:MAG: hypothetical protein JNL34_16855 [Anaerolineae bacterium]|nr:hypothetical protein [Anaerolineae bacterium]
MTTGRRSFSFTTIAFIILLCAALPFAVFAQAETPAAPAATEEPAAVVTVTGTVSQGTPGAAVPADLVVTLHAFNAGMVETTYPAAQSPDGTFTAADVPVYPDHVYMMTAAHQDTSFSGDVKSGSDLIISPALAVTIYDVTEDPSVISISQLQSQAAVSLNELQMLQLYTFTNNSDLAYRAPDGASVRVNVPPGAQIYDMGSARFLISEDGSQMIDRALVLPGTEHKMHVLFTLPYGGEAAISHTVNYPLTNGFEVVISDAGLTVSGEGIEALGGREGGMAFGVPASVPAGGTVAFNLSGIPAPAPAEPTTGTAAPSTSAPGGINIPPLSVLLMVLGGACVGVALVLFIRDRRRAAAAPPASAPDPRVNALVQQIAELDVAFQAGQLSKEDYETQRAALKAQLMSVARDGSKE